MSEFIGFDYDSFMKNRENHQAPDEQNGNFLYEMEEKEVGSTATGSNGMPDGFFAFSGSGNGEETFAELSELVEKMKDEGIDAKVMAMGKIPEELKEKLKELNALVVDPDDDSELSGMLHNIVDRVLLDRPDALVSKMKIMLERTINDPDVFADEETLDAIMQSIHYGMNNKIKKDYFDKLRKMLNYFNPQAQLAQTHKALSTLSMLMSEYDILCLKNVRIQCALSNDAMDAGKSFGVDHLVNLPEIKQVKTKITEAIADAIVMIAQTAIVFDVTDDVISHIDVSVQRALEEIDEEIEDIEDMKEKAANNPQQ